MAEEGILSRSSTRTQVVGERGPCPRCSSVRACESRAQPCTPHVRACFFEAGQWGKNQNNEGSSLPLRISSFRARARRSSRRRERQHPPKALLRSGGVMNGPTGIQDEIDPHLELFL